VLDSMHLYEEGSMNPFHFYMWSILIINVSPQTQRECFIDNLLVRIHFIIEMIWWTGLAPWEFEFPFPVSLISTFLSISSRMGR